MADDVTHTSSEFCHILPGIVSLSDSLLALKPKHVPRDPSGGDHLQRWKLNSGGEAMLPAVGCGHDAMLGAEAAGKKHLLFWGRRHPLV